MVGVALGAAAVGAAGSIASGAMGASSAKDAAKKQQEMAVAQYMLNQQAFKKSQKELSPYSQFGSQQLPLYGQAMDEYQRALSGYNDRLNAYQNAIPDMTGEYTMEQYKKSPLYTPMVTNLEELQATPGYQFQLQQGQQALNQSAAARGGMLSGAQMKAANNYAQNQAATGFQNAWERAQSAYQNAFNQNLQRQRQLQSVLAQNAGLYGQGLGYQQENVTNRGNAARFGYGAARDIATLRGNATNVMGNAMQGYGDAGAAGQLASTGAWQKSLGSLGYGLGAIGNYGANQGWFGGGPTKSYNEINPPGSPTVIV